jgi:hypothetical protein
MLNTLIDLIVAGDTNRWSDSASSARQAKIGARVKKSDLVNHANRARGRPGELAGRCRQGKAAGRAQADGDNQRSNSSKCPIVIEAK